MYPELEKIEEKIRQKNREYYDAMTELAEQKKFLLWLLTDYGTLPRHYKLAVDLHKRLCLEKDCLWCNNKHPNGIPDDWNDVEPARYLNIASNLINKLDHEISEIEYFGRALDGASEKIIDIFLNTVYDE